VIIIDLGKFANIKRYGNEYKLTLLKCLPSGSCGGYREKVNDYKLDCNIKRAKSKIFELSACNEWDYFITGTLDKGKYDRTDLEKYIKDLSQFFRNQRRKYNTDIKYLIIPELHQDGESWHFHGLVKGQLAGAIRQFGLTENLPYRLRKLISDGRVIYDWKDYRNKFGYVTLEQVRSHEAISRYITKYLNKELARSGEKRYGRQLYYRSRGLRQAEQIKKGLLAVAPDNWDYENDYVKILWFNSDVVNNYVK